VSTKAFVEKHKLACAVSAVALLSLIVRTVYFFRLGDALLHPDHQQSRPAVCRMG
jgi:hypothetical protein